MPNITAAAFKKIAISYIETGNNLKLLAYLADFADSNLPELSQELVLIRARQNRLEEQIQNGSIDKDDAGVKQAMLDRSILEFIEELISQSPTVYPEIPPLTLPGIRVFLKKYYLLALGVISLIIAGTITWMPAGSTEVEASISTEGVKVIFHRAWASTEAVSATEIYINELEQLTIPGKEKLEQAYEVSLKGASVNLNKLNLPESSQLDIEIDEQGLHLYVLGKPLTGVFQVLGGTIYTEESEWQIPDNKEGFPSLVEFQTPDKEGARDPVRISLYQTGKAKLLDMDIREIDFLAPGEEGAFFSRILNGQVVIPATGETLSLGERDNMNLQIISCHEFSIMQDDRRLNLRFKGELSQLEAGPMGFEENQMPSIIEKLFARYQISMLVISFCLIILLLLGITRALPKGKGRFFMISLVLTSMLISGDAFAQPDPCDKTIEPINDAKLGYQSRGDLCEGFFISKKSTPYLKLVGVQKGRLRFDPERDEYVSLEIASNPPTKAPFFVKVQSIPLKTYYQMDGLIGIGEVLEWNLGNVVKPQKLEARRLSVLGYFNQENDRIYIPVSAKGQAEPASSESPVLVIFNSNRDIDAFSYEWTDKSGNRIMSEVTQRTIRSGSPIVVPTPQNGQGLYKLSVLVRKIEYDSSNSNNQNYQYIPQIIYVYL